ncbi:small subunit ribosomal protein S1 [Alphaproteobacteria bacterium]
MSFFKNTQGDQEHSIDIVEDFSALLAKHTHPTKQEGKIVKGMVVGIDRDAVIVDVGLKSEGRISLSEFSIDGHNREVKVGDEIDVYVERFEGRSGMTVLSREKALRDEAWRGFEELYAKDLSVKGSIMGKVKGGFAVELGGIVAFLPGSQVDIRPIKDVSVLMNISQPFKILKMDKEHGNVVVSRRAILEDSRKEAKEELLASIKEGMVLEGVVKNITDYGAFIDLSSTDALLHITDISWSKISHPSQILKLNQKIKVQVIKYNPDTQRISVGRKQLEKNPWEDIREKYCVGSKHRGFVIAITDYGAFVSLEPNVDGLVYHTEIHWTAKNVHPSKLLKVGDEVEVLVLDIDIDKHRISLSVKRCQPNSWEIFAEETPVETKVEVVVSGVADFGLFVIRTRDKDTEFPINLLIPSGEISWDKSPEETVVAYHKGDIIECVVTNIDLTRERIAASIKQVNKDKPLELAEKLLAAEEL